MLLIIINDYTNESENRSDYILNPRLEIDLYYFRTRQIDHYLNKYMHIYIYIYIYIYAYMYKLYLFLKNIFISI